MPAGGRSTLETLADNIGEVGQLEIFPQIEPILASFSKGEACNALRVFPKCRLEDDWQQRVAAARKEPSEAQADPSEEAHLRKKLEAACNSLLNPQLQIKYLQSRNATNALVWASQLSSLPPKAEPDHDVLQQPLRAETQQQQQQQSNQFRGWLHQVIHCRVQQQYLCGMQTLHTNVTRLSFRHVHKCPPEQCMTW